ncbi:MAG: glucose-6-phosphate isomerase [Candidatus Omnitrophota bacterium]
MAITLNQDNLKGFVDVKDMDAIASFVEKAHQDLMNKTGKGSEYTGWVDLPKKMDDSFIAELEGLSAEVQADSECLISIGIGGSYLGIRATIEFLRGKNRLPVYYAGHNISSDGLYELIEKVKEKRITVVVISKSGTTTEPALAFRVIKKILEDKYGPQELKKRIICVTDEKKGALRNIADRQGYWTFVIPDDVGGRFSVLTPVGLVPLALAGIDIRELIKGALEGQQEYSQSGLAANPAYQYAAARFLLYKKGKAIEVLSSGSDNLFYVAEWWKQLFGESEGKDGKGIFPASLMLTTDLHSMGQLMQEGQRNIFETFLVVNHSEHSIIIPKEKDDLDNFNCVADQEMDFVNKQAYKATSMAHREGGVPNMTIALDRSDAFHLGQLYYFFEKAVGISGYLLGVNPFDQPGVEAYKKKMFALLGRK